MSNLSKNKNFLLLVIGILSIVWIYYYFHTLINVPFHPDESTQIYMSEDVNLLINHTSELFYQDNPSNPLMQKYRLLDAPITRYAIGVFRLISGVPPLQNDWDWSKTWDENKLAFPTPKMLFVSRLSTAILFPISIVIFFLLSKELFKNNNILIGLSVLLFSLNSLLLLHTRRAMAESSLIFFLTLSLYLLLKLPKKIIFLSAIPIGFAINSKQILIFLVLVGLLLFFYYFFKEPNKLITQTIFFSIIIVSIFMLFNPILWNNPLKAFDAMIKERSLLSQNQEFSIEAVSPTSITDTIPKKIVAWIAQIYILPPSPQEIANYQDALNVSFVNYLKSPFQKGLFRNLLLGTLSFLFFLYGFIRAIINFTIKEKIIFVSAFLLFFLEILFLFKIPFQRYFLPAIPLSILFESYGIFQFYYWVKRKIHLNKIFK